MRETERLARLARQIETLANIASTLIECIGELAENHPDDEVKITIATKLAAFSLSEGIFEVGDDAN